MTGSVWYHLTGIKSACEVYPFGTYCFFKKNIYFLFGDGAGQMLFSEYDQVTLKERKAFRLHVMRTLSSQHRSFKPCSGHMHWLLIQVCVLFSFSYVFSSGVCLQDRHMCWYYFWPTDLLETWPRNLVGLPWLHGWTQNFCLGSFKYCWPEARRCE